MPTYRYMNAEDQPVRNVQIAHDSGRLESFDENSDRWKQMVADGITPDAYVDPESAAEKYDREVLEPLDAAVRRDARLLEEVIDNIINGAPISEQAKARFAARKTARVAARAARPT